MFTLNKLNRLASEFVAQHKQLKSYRLEDNSAFSDIVYPLLSGVLQPSPIEKQSEKIVIRWYVSGKVVKGAANRIDVLSDTKLIGLDVLSYFKQKDYGTDYVDVEMSATMNDFIDADDDEVSGWWFDMTFITKFEWDLCGIPMN